ncbi:major facilitator superfamily domain-containing protein [Mucidula mucida]|nr:major facilitator superfamily domain-containing protein [Mucidula mucida]
MSFIGSVDGTIVATLLSAMASSFESMQLSSWIGTSYLLSVCCFTPLYGRLCNIIGRRSSAMLAAGLFGFGTTCCGFSQTMQVPMIFFRALAGMGGGGMAVVGSVIVSDVVPLKSRGLYQGFANLLFGLGGGVGAPLGGWLGDTIGWRAAFWIQAPILLMGITFLWIQVREPESFTSAPANSIKEKIQRVDFGGPLMLVISLGSLLIAMSYRTSSGYDWLNVHVLGFLIASAVAVILFCIVELKWAVEPVMPLSMLKQRTPAFVALNNFLIAVLSFSTLYNVPLYFTAARLRSSGNAGAHLIPNAFCVATGSLFAGWYMRHTGKYWWLQAIAALGLVVSNCELSQWSEKTPEWLLYVTLMPSGFGFSTVLTTTLLALFASVPREQIPVATGMSYLFRTTGQVLGVALSSTLTQGLLARNLRVRITGEGSESIIEKILDSASSIRYLPLDLQQKATESWALALRTVFYAQIGLATLLFLSTLPIGEHPLPDTVVGAAPKKSVTVDEEAAEEE